MRFFKAIRNIEDHVRAQRLQRLAQHGDRCLAIDIEIAPDQNAVSSSNGILNNPDGYIHSWQSVG